MDRLRLAAVIVLALATPAYADHEHHHHPPEVAAPVEPTSSLTATIGALAASYESPLYEGDYQGGCENRRRGRSPSERPTA